MLEAEPLPVAVRCPQLPAVVADAIGRCLRKSPSERFQSAQEIVAALDRVSAAGSPPTRALWWRTHQLVVIALYVVAGTAAWAVKESFRGAVSLWVFVALGIVAAVAGIVRGHLVFTEHMNPARLAYERRRTRRLTTATDLLLSAALVADALLVLVPVRPLWGVLTMGLALGIALAAVLMEPATTAAAFGEG